MHGRKCSSLLVALLFCILMGLSLLWGQSDSSKEQPRPKPNILVTPLPLPPPKPTLPTPQATGALGLPQLAASAGSIFSGTVASIVRNPATRGHAIETVAITFHVENAIRGAIPGTDLTFSQWMGLWSAGQRYRVGERVLLFLYPPSKMGLTSCVAAPVGRFSISASGRISLTAQQLAAFRADPVLGRRSHVSFSDFAQAVQQATPPSATWAKEEE